MVTMRPMRREDGKRKAKGEPSHVRTKKPHITGNLLITRVVNKIIYNFYRL